jgi:ASC-1-like (ASCH) protein
MTKIHYFTLNTPWYEYVKSGEKIYEGRKCSRKTKEIENGDIIEFKHHCNEKLPSIKVKILSINNYRTFRQALETLPINKILPTPNITVDEGVNIYYRYASHKSQVKDGVCMVEIEKIEDQNADD